MTMRTAAAGLAILLAAGACRTGRAVYDSTPENQSTPGTIAGIVRAGEGGEPLAGRTITAIASDDTSRRYSATTSVTGGFSIPVPPGKYTLEVELREGERVLRHPGTIDINESDLDANLEVIVGE